MSPSLLYFILVQTVVVIGTTRLEDLSEIQKYLDEKDYDNFKESVDVADGINDKTQYNTLQTKEEDLNFFDEVSYPTFRSRIPLLQTSTLTFVSRKDAVSERNEKPVEEFNEKEVIKDPKISPITVQEKGSYIAAIQNEVRPKTTVKPIIEEHLQLPETVGESKETQINETDDVLVLDSREDDYTYFDAQLPANGGPNQNLRQVTLAPIRSTFSTPSLPKTEMVFESTEKNTETTDQAQSSQFIPYNTYDATAPTSSRWGYYYQHYPWDKLPLPFIRRPELRYVYPEAYKNIAYRNPYGSYSRYSGYSTRYGYGSGCSRSNVC